MVRYLLENHSDQKILCCLVDLWDPENQESPIDLDLLADPAVLDFQRLLHCLSVQGLPVNLELLMDL